MQEHEPSRPMWSEYKLYLFFFPPKDFKFPDTRPTFIGGYRMAGTWLARQWFLTLGYSLDILF